MTPVEHLIARRYLFGRKKFTFINIISLLATLGITFGVAALIVVMSVFNGFGSLVTSILQDFDPHVKVERLRGTSSQSLEEAGRLIMATNEPVGIATFIQRKAMITAKGYNDFVWIKGMDPETIDGVSGVRSRLVLGSFDGSVRNGIIVGINVADKMHVLVGDTVTLISPAGMENLLTQYVTPTVLECPVVGIFEAKNKLYDGSYAFLPLDAAARLFRMPKDVSGYEVRLSDINASVRFKERLEQQLDQGWSVRTWYDLHRDLYSVMTIERWSAFALLSIIIAVAVFNILASLTMMVLEKKRDIGVLRTMGLSAARVHRTFLIQGLWIGTVGVLAGLAIGLLVVWLQGEFGLVRLHQAFIIPALPVEVRVTDLAAIVVSTFVLCLVAAWYPARRAQSVEIIDAIRWE